MATHPTASTLQQPVHPPPHVPVNHSNTLPSSLARSLTNILCSARLHAPPSRCHPRCAHHTLDCHILPHPAEAKRAAPSRGHVPESTQEGGCGVSAGVSPVVLVGWAPTGTHDCSISGELPRRPTAARGAARGPALPGRHSLPRHPGTFAQQQPQARRSPRSRCARCPWHQRSCRSGPLRPPHLSHTLRTNRLRTLLGSSTPTTPANHTPAHPAHCAAACALPHRSCPPPPPDQRPAREQQSTHQQRHSSARQQRSNERAAHRPSQSSLVDHSSAGPPGVRGPRMHSEHAHPCPVHRCLREGLGGVPSGHGTQQCPRTPTAR